MNFRFKLTPTLLVIFLISLAGSLLVYFSTHWGPWAFSDSTGYIVSARNLLAGHGLGYPAPSGSFIPYTLHPPFYPLVLSAIGLAGFDLVEAARWLNIFLFGATIFISGVFAYTLFHSSWLALALSVSLLTLPGLVDISSGAMSEPLFLFTATLAICLLIQFLRQRKRYLLVLSAVSGGLAALSRYPGIVVIFGCIMGLLAAIRIPWKQKVRDSLLFSLISITPLASWLLWIFYQSRTLGARTFPIPSDLWASTIDLRKRLLELFWSWLPYREHLPTYSYNTARNYLIALLIGILILAGLILSRRLLTRRTDQISAHTFSFALLWMFFTLGNLALLAGSYLFTSPVPDINLRTLLPVQFGLVFVILSLIACAAAEFRLPGAAGWVCALLALILILPNAQASWKLINLYYQYGDGYTNSAWHNSLTLQVLRNMPSEVPIITNQAAAVLLHLDRPAYEFCSPACNQAGTLAYGDDPQDPVQRIFSEDGAALVLFYPYCGVQEAPWYANTLTLQALLTQGLRRYFSSCDGSIYFYPSTSQN